MLKAVRGLHLCEIFVHWLVMYHLRQPVDNDEDRVVTIVLPIRKYRQSRHKGNSESKITTPSTSPMQRLSTTGNISSEMCSALPHLAICRRPYYTLLFYQFFIMFTPSKEVITDGYLEGAACSVFTRV